MLPPDVIEQARASAPEILRLNILEVTCNRLGRPNRLIICLRYCGYAIVEDVIRSTSGLTPGSKIAIDYETIPPWQDVTDDDFLLSLGNVHQPLLPGRCTAFMTTNGAVFAPIVAEAFSPFDWQPAEAGKPN